MWICIFITAWLFRGHRGKTSEAFFVLINWTSWRKWQGCIESFVIVTCSLPTNTAKDITMTKDILIFDWPKGTMAYLTEKKKRIPRRHWLVRSCSHSLVKPFTWLQNEMRNAKVTVWSKWSAEQCYFNHSDSVTGISVYISHIGRDIIIRLLQSIKTIVEYVVCWFLSKLPV